MGEKHGTNEVRAEQPRAESHIENANKSSLSANTWQDVEKTRPADLALKSNENSRNALPGLTLEDSKSGDSAAQKAQNGSAKKDEQNDAPVVKGLSNDNRKEDPKTDNTHHNDKSAHGKDKNAAANDADTSDNKEKGNGNDKNKAEGDKKVANIKPESEMSSDEKLIASSREQLSKSALDNIHSTPELQKFNSDLNSFEKRAADQGIPAKDVAATYDQMSTLMNAKDGAVPKDDRILAAKSLAHHLGDGTNADQGHNNTCGVTALGEKLIANKPATAAEIVTSTALNGSWTNPADGKNIKLDAESLKPGKEENTFPPAHDGDRTYATKLMNVTLANDISQRRETPQYYSQTLQTENRKDTGERLTFADGRELKESDLNKASTSNDLVRSPGVYPSELAQSLGRLTGEKGTVIEHKNLEKDNNDVAHVGNSVQLANKLAQLQADKQMPALLTVDAADPKFNDLSSGLKSNSWHEISITSYDKDTNKAKVSNQWGKKGDIEVDANDLYWSTIPTTGR